MAYSSYYDVDKIVSKKKEYDEAKASGNKEAMSAAAEEAQKYYNSLRQNGYSDIANQLQNSDYSSADQLRKKVGTQGKTGVREYFYNKGKQYGLNTADIDKALSYNNATGELSLGGMNIGKPYSNVDGTTYSDTATLDKSFDNYVKKMGITKTPDVQYNEGLVNIQKKVNDIFSLTQSDHDAMNEKYNRLEEYGYSNPYDTDIADSIMADYKWKGQQASNEAVASGGGSNSGNIDSYAAANASRQQLAFTNAGKAAVLEDYNQRIANIQNILNNLGAYNQSIYDTQHQNVQLDMQNNQRIFDNNETSKTNEFNREAQKAEITGYIPKTWADSDNKFLNADGTLKEVDGIDYQEIINNAQAAYEKTGDTSYLKTINDARVARAKKVLEHFDKYGQYAGSLVMPTQTETANVRTANEDRKSAERMNADNNSTIRHQSDNATALGKYQSDNDVTLGKYQSDNDNAIRKYEADKNFELGTYQLDKAAKEPKLSISEATEAIKNGEISQNVIDAYNYYYGTNYTVNNPPQFGGVKGSKKMSDWVTWANGRKNNFSYDESTGELKYIGDGSYDTQVQLVKAALNDTNLSDAEKKQVVSLFGAAVLEEALRMIQVGR